MEGHLDPVLIQVQQGALPLFENRWCWVGITMGQVMTKFGVFQTTHTVTAALCAGVYAKVGRKSALAVLVIYYWLYTSVKKKLKQGGIIRTKPTGPYKNLTVLDLSMVLAGPLAGQMLSELGAQVINIESTKQPDAGRLFGRGPARGLSGLYANSGRGKQSIVLDLKQASGLQAFYDLVKKSDVVIQNFRPGAVERMKVSYQDCLQYNNDIIYCSSSGFGTSGPYKDLRVYDPIIQTVAGASHAQGTNGDGPQLIGQAFCDKLTAMTSAQAIGAALVVRAQGGGGQHIQTDMLKVALQSLWPEVYQSHTFLSQHDRMAMASEPADYKCLYGNNPESTSTFNSVQTAMDDPLFHYDQVEHLLFGKARVGCFPVSFSATPTSKREAAVLVGEHTRKILTELNYSTTQINSMLAENSATSTQSLISRMGNSKETSKKAMVFGLLETLQSGRTFAKKNTTNRSEKKRGSKDGPLMGLKVLDITMNIAGPTCTQVLADQEATVIKIEFSDLEDPTRSLGPMGHVDYSAMFASLNRQKLSILIRQTEEIDVIDQLLQWCDIVIIDDTIEQLKSIDYARALIHNPDVIYCVIKDFELYNELKLQELTGAGDCQPETYNGDSYRTTHSRRNSGMGGGLNIQVKRRGPAPYYSHNKKLQPSYTAISIFAKAIGFYCANSITAALYVKATQRRGQKIVVDALKCGCHFVMPDVQWNGVWPSGTFMKNFPELIQCKLPVSML